jgi:hypothetical protein
LWHHKPSGKTVDFGRIVLEAFVGPAPILPSGQPALVRHLNDFPWDNRLANLAWGTTAENAKDAVRNKPFKLKHKNPFK